MRQYISRFAVAGAAALLMATGVSRLHAAAYGLTQDAEPCSVTLGPTPTLVPMGGGTFTINVPASRPAGCTWPLASSRPFARITAVSATTATVEVDPNVAAGPGAVAARGVDLQIADKRFWIVQDGAPAATPWDIGDVFVGAGSYADSPGVYRTLAPQGERKLDSGLVADPPPPVADLIDGAGFFSNGCMVDPTAPDGNGHLFTAAWTANTLSIFDALTHQLRDVFRFSDQNTIDPFWGVGVNTPLAALPRSAGIPPLPPAAIGVADDPATPEYEFVAPEIQGFEQVVFAGNGDFYVGTQTPATNNFLGLGRGYLLRLRYTPDAAARLTLTGWWVLDAGAVVDRSKDRALEKNDAYADGTSRGASGVDQFDLSSDQKTIFYTSEDNFIRRYDVAASVQLPDIELTTAAGNPLEAKAYGLRILPGPLDGDGNATPADGSAGFLVATSASIVFRVDATGREVRRYDVPAKPFALTLTPDAQYFWTAITQDQPEDPVPAGRFIYRFHIATGARETFEPGTSGVHGLCVKREYSAATANGVCYVRNDKDGNNEEGSYGPGTSACRTPPVCSAVRGPDSDPGCFPPGVSKPVYEDQTNSEGETVSLDLNRFGLVFNHVLGLEDIHGLTFSRGEISGTISPTTCPPGPGGNPLAANSCEFTLLVQWLVEGDAQNRWNETPFTWTITHGNSKPKLSLAASVSTTLVALKPATIPLTVSDADSEDHILVSITGLPAGMSTRRRTSYGNGWLLDITGAPGAAPPYPQQYPVHVDIWDCQAAYAQATETALAATGATAAESDVALRAAVTAGIAAGTCYHNATSLDFTITVVNQTPTFPVAGANQTNVVGFAIAGYSLAVNDADAHLPVTFQVSGLPAGLTCAHANPASTVAADQRLVCSGTPTSPINNAAVTVEVTDLAGGKASTSFTWTVTNTPPTLTVAPRSTLINTPVKYQIAANDPDGHSLTWSISGLPSGLNASSTGLVTGTPDTVSTQTVSVTVSDSFGGSVTRTFPWTIFSNRPPVCTAATVTPKLLWPPNHKLVPFSITNVTDPDGDAPTIAITSIWQNQPVNDTGDGNTGFDATGVDPSSGAVRAERTGNLRVPGDGRLYFVSFTATDGKGGSCDRILTIAVPHDQGQRNLPIDNGCRWDSVTGNQLGPCAWLNAPVLSLSNRTNVEGAVVNLQVTAPDPDGTPLTYTATSLPPGLSMSSSGLITGTIAPGAAGGKSKMYTVTVSVSDGHGTVKSTVTWTVTRP